MQNLKDKVQSESRGILKAALPQNPYFNTFLIGLVQKSSYYYRIKDFFKYICDFVKYKSLRKKLLDCPAWFL